jgi:hypothetical protein
VGPTQIPIEWIPKAVSQGREADRSPPSSANVKNGGGLPPLPYTSPWHDVNPSSTGTTFLNNFILPVFLNNLFSDSWVDVSTKRDLQIVTPAI